MMIIKLRDVRDGVLSLPDDPFLWEIDCAQKIRNKWSVSQAVFEPATTSRIPQSKALQKEAKGIYRELARRFHPDLAETEKIRQARTEIMAEINQAYRDQDLEKLKEMKNRPDIRDPERETVGETLIRLIRRVAQLRRLVKEAEHRLDDQKQSDLAKLMDRCSDAEETQFDFLQSMLQEQIDRAKFEWLNQRVREARLWTEVEQ